MWDIKVKYLIGNISYPIHSKCPDYNASLQLRGCQAKNLVQDIKKACLCLSTHAIKLFSNQRKYVLVSDGSIKQLVVKFHYL